MRDILLKIIEALQEFIPPEAETDSREVVEEIEETPEAETDSREVVKRD